MVSTMVVMHRSQSLRRLLRAFSPSGGQSYRSTGGCWWGPGGGGGGGGGGAIGGGRWTNATPRFLPSISFASTRATTTTTGTTTISSTISACAQPITVAETTTTTMEEEISPVIGSSSCSDNNSNDNDSIKDDIDIDDQDQQLETIDRHKDKHFYSRTSRSIKLPDQLHKLMKERIPPENSAQTELKQGVEVLTRQLWSRKVPVERGQLQAKAKQLQKEQFGEYLESLSKNDFQEVMPKIKEIIVNKLRTTTYHWQPMQYDAFGASCYLFGRMAMDYAIMRNVFQEMRILDPSFRPRSCFDYGSGVGSVWWALKEEFPSSFNEYFSVELSMHMRDIARQLAQGGPSGKDLPTHEYAQRAQLPLRSKLTYDLAVSAFSLSELPTRRERIDVIENLWSKTVRHLIIVENGTHCGFELVKEAREHILTLNEKRHDNDKKDIWRNAYVLGPCTHNLPCQRLAVESRQYPCSFPVRYRDLLTDADEKSLSSLYSYVILSKVQPKVQVSRQPSARLIEEVLCRGKHVICRMCTSKGEIKETVFTKRKHDRTTYSAARKAHWGDLFPFEDAQSARRPAGVKKETEEQT